MKISKILKYFRKIEEIWKMKFIKYRKIEIKIF